MEDKRRVKRWNLIYYLKVFDQKRKRLIGQVVDITTEGVRLISEMPIKTGTVFKLKMDLPDLPEKAQAGKQITFDARSIWCKKDINPDFYDTGFEIVKISQKNAKTIERLVEDFLLHA